MITKTNILITNINGIIQHIFVNAMVNAKKDKVVVTKLKLNKILILIWKNINHISLKIGYKYLRKERKKEKKRE
jgi:hypothetical protein